MSGSREDRLSRIRRYVESHQIHTRQLSAWDKDGNVATVNVEDVAWILGQIPTVYEYSVERGSRTFDDGPYVWTPWCGPYERQETAERMAADRRRPGVDVKYRVSRRPAPAWTPVEDLS